MLVKGMGMRNVYLDGGDSFTSVCIYIYIYIYVKNDQIYTLNINSFLYVNYTSVQSVNR